MKRFVFGALACTAFACPVLADDELGEVAAEACPVVEETLVADSVLERCGTPEPDAEISVTCDLEVVGHEKDGYADSDDSVDITAVLDGGPILTTTADGELNDGDGSEIIYFSTTSTSGGNSSEASLSVNQLADEQRNSLRFFSGRENASEKGGKASSFKELFASQSKVNARATTRTITVAERDLARRKAEIDQLRDRALRTGDTALMARADAMAAAQPTAGKAKARSFFKFGVK